MGDILLEWQSFRYLEHIYGVYELWLRRYQVQSHIRLHLKVCYTDIPTIQLFKHPFAIQ